MFNDKERRSIRFFSMYGEPLLAIDRLEHLTNFAWRPRPRNLLKKSELKELKSTYKKTYKKSQREEDQAERSQANESIRLKKKDIRDEFLNNFYLPNRKAYEDNIEEFIALWPLKDSTLTDKEVAVNHIFAYGDLKDTKRIEHGK
jgi:hypothetical protein